jgi:hypothetical protein
MVENHSKATSSGSSQGDPLEPLRPLGRFLREHPAIAVSLVYLQVTTVGVVYSWVLFRRFDINIFDYAETNDFLLAAFRDPIVFGMSMLTFVIYSSLVLAMHIYTRRRMEKHVATSELVVPSYTSPIVRTSSISPVLRSLHLPLLFIFYSLIPPYSFATWTAESLLEPAHHEPLTSVQYRAMSGSNEQTKETGLRMIGTTQSYVFFYDREETRTLIIPHAQIVEIEHSIEYIPHGTIYPGRYTAREFEPALSFSVSDDGWQLSNPETPDDLSLEGPEGGQLTFASPRHVYDPSNPSEPKEVPAPKNTDEWVSWFQSHPNLNTSEPVPMSVGGASGKRIDVTVTSTPENYPQDLCGEQPCIPLYSTSMSSTISYEGFKDQFVIVDVGGETVIIDVGASTDKFDEFLPKAQKVLDTVEWKGG